jgi:hypothetical protein
MCGCGAYGHRQELQGVPAEVMEFITGRHHVGVTDDAAVRL